MRLELVGDRRRGRRAGDSTSPRLMSISSASVSVTDWPATASVEVAVDGDDALHLRSLPDGSTRTAVARRDPPPTIVPAKPRKSRFGRLTHCTGMRNGTLVRRLPAISHRFQVLEQRRPVYHGVFGARAR